MTFAAAALIVLLLVIVTRKYRSILSVFLAGMLLISATTAVLLWGLARFGDRETIHFFTAVMDRHAWYPLMAVWYGADAVVIILIIRSHIEYRKVNAGMIRRK